MSGDWRHRGNCAGTDPEVFFDERAPWAAKQICRGCPVADHCLADALKDPTTLGVWGGTDPTDRDEIRTGRRRRDTPERHIRRWAWEQGIRVAGGGRLPRYVIDAYEDAQKEASA